MAIRAVSFFGPSEGAGGTGDPGVKGGVIFGCSKIAGVGDFTSGEGVGFENEGGRAGGGVILGCSKIDGVGDFTSGGGAGFEDEGGGAAGGVAPAAETEMGGGALDGSPSPGRSGGRAIGGAGTGRLGSSPARRAGKVFEGGRSGRLIGPVSRRPLSTAGLVAGGGGNLMGKVSFSGSFASAIGAFGK